MSVPTVRLSTTAWAKISALQRKITHEFTTLGSVSADDPLLVEDVWVLPQTGSSAHVEMSDEALAKFTVAAFETGVGLERIRFWHHSHADMGVFFSGTDTGTIDKLGSVGIGKEGHLISMVTNRKFESEVRVDLYSPFRHSFEKCPWKVEIQYPDVSAWADSCAEVVKKDVVPPFLHKAAGLSAPPSGIPATRTDHRKGRRRGKHEVTLWDDRAAWNRRLERYMGDLRCTECASQLQMTTEGFLACPVCGLDEGELADLQLKLGE